MLCSAVSDMLAALGSRLQRLSMRYSPSSSAWPVHGDQLRLVRIITEHCPLLMDLAVDNLGSSRVDVAQSPQQMQRRQVLTWMVQ